MNALLGKALTCSFGKRAARRSSCLDSCLRVLKYSSVRFAIHEASLEKEPPFFVCFLESRASCVWKQNQQNTSWSSLKSDAPQSAPYTPLRRTTPPIPSIVLLRGFSLLFDRTFSSTSFALNQELLSNTEKETPFSVKNDSVKSTQVENKLESHADPEIFEGGKAEDEISRNIHKAADVKPSIGIADEDESVAEWDGMASSEKSETNGSFVTSNGSKGHQVATSKETEEGSCNFDAPEGGKTHQISDENPEKAAIDKEETAKLDRNKEVIPEKNQTVSRAEEFGFRYEGPEPTQFGDWAHGGRVTDF